VLLIVCIVTVGHVLSPGAQVGDSRLSVPVANAILRHGTLDLRADPLVTALTDKYDVVRRGERVLPFFPWPPMLLALPGAVAMLAVGRDPGTLRPSGPNQTWVVEVPTASFIVALTAWAFAAVALELTAGDLRRRRRFAVAVALIFAFSTGAWSTASRALWQHTPSMLVLMLAVLFALRIGEGRAYAFGFGVVVALSFAIRPSNSVAVALLLVWLVWQHRRSAGWAGCGIAAVVAPFVLINLLTYGSLLPPYFAATRLGTEAWLDFGETFAMNLVSPSRGLLVYDPIVFLAVAGFVIQWRRVEHRPLFSTLLVVLATESIVVARYGSTGGAAYGPRLMMDMLPFLAVLAVPVLAKVFLDTRWRDAGTAQRLAVVAVAGVIAWGVVVNASGALFRSSYCWSATPVIVDARPSRVWDWGDPQFARPIRDLAAGRSIRSVVIGSCAR